jgi:hypothetical protein
MEMIVGFALRSAERFRQGLVVLNNGGNGGIFVEMMAMAAQFLGRPQALLDVVKMRVEGGIPGGNFGTAAQNPGPTTGASVHSGFNMSYVVTTAMLTNPAYAAIPHVTEEVGGGGWVDSSGTTLEGPPTDDVSIQQSGVPNAAAGKAAYRHIDAQNRSRARLALAMNGAVDILFPLGDASQRAIDGYMQRRIENAQVLPDGYGNDVEANTAPGALAMWTAYRGTQNLFVLPSYAGALSVHSLSPNTSGALTLTAHCAVNFTDFVKARSGTWTGAIKLQRDSGAGYVDIATWNFPTNVVANRSSTGNTVWFSGRAAMLKPPATLVKGGLYRWVIAANVIESATAPGLYFAGGTFNFVG